MALFYVNNTKAANWRQRALPLMLMVKWQSLILGLLLVCDCNQSTTTFLPLIVQYDGCDEVLVGPTCILSASGDLRLWVALPQSAQIKIYADNNKQNFKDLVIANGRVLTFTVNISTKHLTVKANNDQQQYSWSLSLMPPRPPPTLLANAKQLRDTGKLDMAIKLLTENVPALPINEKGAGWAALARLERLVGKPEQAIADFESAQRYHRQTAKLLSEVDDATAMAYVLIYSGLHLKRARQVLTSVSKLLPNNLKAAYLVAFYQGVLASHTADFRSALSAFASASSYAEKMGNTLNQHFADQMRASTLLGMGQPREALKILGALLQDASLNNPCERYHLLENCAWALILAREAGDNPANWNEIAFKDPQPLLHEALTGGCNEYPEWEGNTFINLALTSIHLGNLQQAQQYLNDAREHLPRHSSLPALWGLDIEARLALLEKRPRDALKIYSKLTTQAQVQALAEVKWRSLIGQAQAYTALSRLTLAHAAYSNAEQLVYESSLNVPLYEGRDTFLAKRLRATQQHVELLLKMGDFKQALQIVRQNRVQLLAGVQWQDQIERLDQNKRRLWDDAIATYHSERRRFEEVATNLAMAPRNEIAPLKAAYAAQEIRVRSALDIALALVPISGLRTPPILTDLQKRPASELTLVYYRLPTSWIGFAVGHGVFKVQHLGLLPDDDKKQQTSSINDTSAQRQALAHVLLEPFRHELKVAKRLHIIASSDLERFALHALPLDGKPLEEILPVAYVVDAAPIHHPKSSTVAEKSTAISTTVSWHSLVVADTTGDLPQARYEGQQVAAALATKSRVRMLMQREATFNHVSNGLNEAMLFHFAGHSDYIQNGFSSSLRLADGAQLRAGDILALKRVPLVIVLSACESARVPVSEVSTIGLAQAFIIAGARVVIASSRPVNDAFAAYFGEKLYELLLTKLNEPMIFNIVVENILPKALRLARERFPSADWSGYRVLVP
ncbi:MAG: CHAT domain-containing protein [Deltaproteobacteria bacterium]|nr:CHAT domain-containing protein [Deltaproteobacteria bacterium]